MGIFPEMPDVLGYFSDTSNWLNAVLEGLGNFENISSANFNFRLLSSRYYIHIRILGYMYVSVKIGL